MSCICIYVQPSPALQCYVESELLSMLHWLGRSENAARTLKGEEQLEGAWPEHWRPNQRSTSPAVAVRVEVRLGEGMDVRPGDGTVASPLGWGLRSLRSCRFF